MAHRLHELPGDWYVEVDELKEVYRILKVGQVLLDHLEDRFGLQMPESKENKGNGTGRFRRLKFKMLKGLPFHSKIIKNVPRVTESHIDVNSLDINGDTRLLVALKRWPKNSKSPKHFEKI